MLGFYMGRLCKTCNRDTGSRRSRCPKHAMAHKIEMRKLREKRKKNTVPGIAPPLCPRCWERKKEPGLEACFECAFGKKKSEVEDWVALVFPNFKDYVKKANGKSKVVTSGEKLRSLKKLKE